MKNQKSLTIITGIVTLISMVSYLASGRGSDAAKIVSDLSLAIFGSALLGFITKRNLFVKKIFDDINTLSGKQYEGNPYTWEVSIISPLLQ